MGDNMKVKDLIEVLTQCNPDIPIIVFGDDSRPYEIESVTVDKEGNGELSHINLKELDGSMV